jgi:PhnB protein
MNATPYLNFTGDCREAFATYQQVLGGELRQLTYGQAPPQPPGADGCGGGEPPPGSADLIMHASLLPPQAQAPLLMGSDMPPGTQQQGRGGIAVALDCADNAEAERVFAALAQGGQVQMPIAETFWAERFGMLVDRFGIPWLINGTYKPM